MTATDLICPKCRLHTGDDWSQCGPRCPMPMAPNFHAELAIHYIEIGRGSRAFHALLDAYGVLDHVP